MFERELSFLRKTHGPRVKAERMDTAPLLIAIASGKGGTGKTFVTTNLAVLAKDRGIAVQVLDCDVEAPNAHLFLCPKVEKAVEVRVPVPTVDEKKCDSCGECGRVCRFSAIVSLKTKPLVFPELCHGCGGCLLICPQRAIIEDTRVIGRIELGGSAGIRFAGGRLRIGEAMAPPLIRAVKKQAATKGLILVDAPPGTSCPVIETVRGADGVLLVTEPTPFGLSDLKLAVATMEKLGLPFGVVVNRAAPGRDLIRVFCDQEKIEILAEIPDDRRVAEMYSRGETAVRTMDLMAKIFQDLLGKVQGMERAAWRVRR